MTWKILFCSGLNQGVEVPLPEGRVVIGSDPAQADLVMVDAGIGAIQLILEVSALRVSIVHWAEDTVATQGGEPVVAGADLQAFLAQGCGPLRWMFCAQGQQFDQALPARPAAPRKSPSGRALRWLPGIVAVGCVVLALALLPLIKPWAAAPQPGDPQAQQYAVHAYLVQQQLADVVIAAPQPGVGLLLSGYVQHNDQRVALQQFLQATGAPFQLAVRAQEDIRNDVDFILPRLGYKDAHSADGNQAGWVRLVGEGVQDPTRWQQTLQTLKNDVQGLRGVEPAVEAGPTPLQKLQQLLDIAGLTSRLTVKASNSQIDVSGALDERQQDAFKEVQRQYNAAFTLPPTLNLQNTWSPKKQAAVQFPIKAVSIGRVPYVILTDNRRYPVGGLTPTGLQVVGIHSNRVVLSRQGQQFIINLRGDASDDP